MNLEGRSSTVAGAAGGLGSATVRGCRSSSTWVLGVSAAGAPSAATVRQWTSILNLHLERAVLATIGFALTAEDRTFISPELRANLDRFLTPKEKSQPS